MNDIGRQTAEVLAVHYPASDALLRRTEVIAERLAAVNPHMNLTALTSPEEMVLLHVYDSLALLSACGFKGKRVVDVGCGGGFPALPLAAAVPEASVTALDATAKKLEFVAQTAQAADLPNVSTLCGRAEELGREPSHREAFDVAVSRGVARLNVLAEWSLPLVKPGGLFVAMKGPRGEEEAAEAARAFELLGGGAVSVIPYEIPVFGRSHRLIVVEKKAGTPGIYPRPNGKIMKKPL